MTTLQLSEIGKSFGATKVIHDIDLTIESGEFLVFVGPSGCGKSTMLRMIAGLETITAGTLSIDDDRANDMAPVDRGIAMVFQSYALYPNMTVRQNLMFSLEQAKRSKAEIAEKVQATAELLQIVPLLDRRPGELSGGQSQRVAIGRAIVRDPKIFLFDEPLSNLDAELRVHMRAEIKALHARLGRTTVYVTHDQVEAMTMADRIVVFRDGKIEQIGRPLELYNAPATRFVAGFIGSPRMNFVECAADDPDMQTLAQEFGLNAPVTLGFRPEHIELSAPDTGHLRGTVSLTEQLGGESFVHVILDSGLGTIVIKSMGQTCPAIAAKIGISIPKQALYAFDALTEEAVLLPSFDDDAESK